MVSLSDRAGVLDTDTPDPCKRNKEGVWRMDGWEHAGRHPADPTWLPSRPCGAGETQIYKGALQDIKNDTNFDIDI